MSSKSLTDLAKEFDAKVDESFKWKPHVFPRYQSPVILGTDGSKIIAPMVFGLIPFFEKELKPKKVFHNARFETIDEKVSFKKAFAETRCLIPVDSFFEYVDGPGGKKRLVQFKPKDDQTMLAAGIWSLWKSPDGQKIKCYSMVTAEPPPIIEEIGHDRCPLFLGKDDQAVWLDKIGEKDKKRFTKELIKKDFEYKFIT